MGGFRVNFNPHFCGIMGFLGGILWIFGGNFGGIFGGNFKDFFGGQFWGFFGGFGVILTLIFGEFWGSLVEFSRLAP